MPVNVRVIAATNRDLQAEVHMGRFREDLFFRLGVFPLRVPPLADRREDIPSLVAHFLALHCEKFKRPVPKVSEAAMLELETRDYRGNVRELSNLIERGLLLTDPGEVMSPEHLFDRPVLGASAGDPSLGDEAVQGLHGAVAGFERGFIKKALDRNEGSRTRTAKELRISARWLTKKMKRLGLIDEADDTDDDDVDGEDEE